MQPLEPLGLTELLRGRPQFAVFTSRSQIAAALWDFGEDGLAARALSFDDSELAAVERIASWYEHPGYPLPVTGRVTHRHVGALAAVTFCEGRVRALARSRRRPERNRPAAYTPLPPDPGRLI
ncbi:hypothetical protein [Nakamurella deserti]|uniref:hypothetical protein n=1 Tax=Nakamurella deserti TaxID=2164074 RepID=UPI000DBE64AE|nr:hypothetical protein [Nakamurella deserti]